MKIRDKDELYKFLQSYCDVGSEEDCWLYTGPIDKKLGYGIMSIRGRRTAAHREVFIMAYGEYLKIINGRKTCIRHLCNNRQCINPNHLALGTYSDNSKDASVSGKNVRMNKDKLITALKLRKSGLTYKAIGKEIGVGEVVVSMALNGRTYYGRELLMEVMPMI